MTTIEIGLSLFSLFVSGFSTVLWWTFKNVKSTADATKDELALFRLHVATSCVLKNDFKDAFDAIFKKLDRIEDRLNQANQHQVSNQ